MNKKTRIAQMQLLRVRLLRDIEQCAKAIAALENAESKARKKQESIHQSHKKGGENVSKFLLAESKK